MINILVFFVSAFKYLTLAALIISILTWVGAFIGLGVMFGKLEEEAEAPINTESTTDTTNTDDQRKEPETV